MPKNPKNIKKLIIILCIVLTVILAAGSSVFAYKMYNKSTENTPSGNISASSPAASGDSVFNANPNSSDTDTESENIQSDWSSYEDDDPYVSKTETVPRVEKVVKTYKFEDEFFAPLYDKLYFKDSKSGINMPYSLSLPQNYTKNKKYPVLLLLHGRGALGTNHSSASTSFSTLFKYSGDLLGNSIIVIPQTNTWWNIDPVDQKGTLDVVMRLIENIEATYSCDTNRVYVMGLSMGGNGTWNMLQYYGDHFAAGVPICGWGDTQFAKKLANIPIWIYHGEQDDTVNIGQSEAMYNAIINAGGKKIHFTRLPSVKHDSWLNAFRSRELLSWLYSQNKAENPSADFDYIPYFKVVDSKGKTVITELDSRSLALVNVNGEDTLEFTLTTNGARKLGNAYINSNGKNFDVYYGNQKLLTFTATKKSSDDLFVVEKVFTSKNYWWYYKRIADVLGLDY